MDLPSTLCAAWMSQVFCLVGAWVVFCIWPPAGQVSRDWWITLFIWDFRFIIASCPCVIIATLLLMKDEANEENIITE